MTDQQKNVIQDGWQILRLDLGNIGVLTFVRYVDIIDLTLDSLKLSKVIDKINPLKAKNA